jgi:serine/threonine protein kinase
MPAGARKLTPEPGRSGKARIAPDQRQRLAPGLAIGPDYRLERPLGRSGSVWLATDASGLPVALKSGPRALLAEEHAAVASLAHPNILAVEELIDVEAGCFSVAEYLSGGDLVSLAGLHPRHWLRPVGALIDALEYLHGRGLVHRDLKPRNVMLDEAENARLIDFGSALPVGSAWSRGGTTIVPPARGSDPVTFGDDLFALASLLHELLHGVPAGHAPRRPAAAGSMELARLVDSRLATAAENGHPGLLEFRAVIKSMGMDQGICA